MFADDWDDDHDDSEGVLEDREVYNMDTGWSLTDLELDDADFTDDDTQVCVLGCTKQNQAKKLQKRLADHSFDVDSTCLLSGDVLSVMCCQCKNCK